jgi:hypothetical protein
VSQAYYAVRHRERKNMFLNAYNMWAEFPQAKLHVFANKGVLSSFASQLHYSLELVRIWALPERAGLN